MDAILKDVAVEENENKEKRFEEIVLLSFSSPWSNFLSNSIHFSKKY